MDGDGIIFNRPGGRTLPWGTKGETWLVNIAEMEIFVLTARRF